MTNNEAIKEIEKLDDWISKHPSLLNDWCKTSDALDMAIKALEQQLITWIVGKDNCQVAVRNMPIDKMQKICAIIGDEEQQLCEDMRDATEEERESTKNYIDSISKPTGLQFDDIYEELDFVQPHKKISVKLRLCEDCISRESVLDELDKYIDKAQSTGTRDDFISFQELVVKSLPSVTPQPKTGHWIGVETLDSALWHECSECGETEFYATDYCPNCGAKMEVEE